MNQPDRGTNQPRDGDHLGVGETDLAAMLRSLDAVRRPASYVYAALPSGHPALQLADAVIVEDEAVTAVLRRDLADEAGLEYAFVAAWITLTVQSSLAAIGLTAAFSHALGEAHISCNVLAGFHHDHILVPEQDGDRALEVLRAIASPTKHDPRTPAAVGRADATTTVSPGLRPPTEVDALQLS